MSENNSGISISRSGLGRAIVGVTLLLKSDALTDRFEAKGQPEKPNAQDNRRAERAPKPNYGGTQRVVLPAAMPEAAPAKVAKDTGTIAAKTVTQPKGAAADVRARTKTRPARASPKPSVIPRPVFGSSSLPAPTLASPHPAPDFEQAKDSKRQRPAPPAIAAPVPEPVPATPQAAAMELVQPSPDPVASAARATGTVAAPAAQPSSYPASEPPLQAEPQVSDRPLGQTVEPPSYAEARLSAAPATDTAPASTPAAATSPSQAIEAPTPMPPAAVPPASAELPGSALPNVSENLPAESGQPPVPSEASNPAEQQEPASAAPDPALPLPVSEAPAPEPVAEGAPEAAIPEPQFGRSGPDATGPRLSEAPRQAPKLAIAMERELQPLKSQSPPGPEPEASEPLPEPAFGGPQQPQRQPLSDAALAGVTGLGLPAPVPGQALPLLPGTRQPGVNYIGRDTSPSVGPGIAVFGPEDELILQIETAGGEMTDTIVAYGTRSGVFIPFGAFARFMDLAISVGDGGNYASGWFLDESKTVTIDLNKRSLSVEGKELSLAGGDAAAYEGELYLRAERYPGIFPLTLDIDLRNQSIKVKTLVPFPFEARLAREAARGRLGAQQGRDEAPRWPREETPYQALSFPMGDAELRGIADNTLGNRFEGDLRLAGDLAFMTAQTFVSGSSRDGIIGARLQLGRRDPDARLLGPLKATEFQIGDVNTISLPLGLRGTGGRGAFVTNTPLESASVFDKVDLRGELLDGYEVELYRNNILIDSTRSAVNGQYEFLQVPVDYGLNVFRFVFYGPQGQRREEVKRISVGDGRLAKGQLVYSFGAVQKGTNIFDVHGPNYSPVDDEGSWRSSALLQYGLTSGLTASLGGAWFESEGRKNWMATAGFRAGIAGVATRLDFGVQNGGGKAVQLGLGGALLGATYTLEHAEYRGRFNDEVNGISLNPLRRATEFNLNTSLNLGGDADGLYLPISARLQRLEYLNGQRSVEASLRASARAGGFMVSNTLDYEQASNPFGFSFSQLRGAFDLATISGSRIQFRAGAEYGIAPRVKLSTVKLDIDYALDKNTLLRGSVNHGFDPSQTQFGLSAVRKLGKFTLAFEGNYGVPRREYSAALRLGFSFGRNPLTGGFFLDKPGLSSGGAVAIRAFQDRNGDGRYDADDTLLPDVEFGNGSNRIETDKSGNAFLGNMGDSHPASFKVNLETLPDISLSPKSEGVEIVPRPGRIHVSDFAVRTLGEVEGTAYFGGDGASKGVSGLSLQLYGEQDKPVAKARTEADGFFLFERVPPGVYAIRIDPEQAERLKIRLAKEAAISVDAEGSVSRIDITVVQD